MSDRIVGALASRMRLHHELVDRELRLLGTNPRFWELLGREPPGEPLPLAEVFPELVGLEDEIEHLAGSGSGELEIPEINRVHAARPQVAYFTLSVVFDPELGPGPIVILEDTTRQSEFHRNLLQSRNENSLLRDRLVEKSERLRETARKLARAKRDLSARNEELRVRNDEVRRYSHDLEGEVRERTRDLRQSRLEVIRRLAQASEFRDAETGQHVMRMSRYSVLLASRIGIGEAECELLLQASPLHDVGKIAIPDAILLKPGSLDAAEWANMKRHTTYGYKLLAGSDSVLMRTAADIAKSHHERWDGGGYPEGSRGEAIPVFGRICALTDTFDALTSRRPYKEAWPVDRAWEEMHRLSGLAFDPELLRVFLSIAADVDRIRLQFSEGAADLQELRSD
jgi:response regulator RpfG family c-di-GMP phosphodiesterase